MNPVLLLRQRFNPWEAGKVLPFTSQLYSPIREKNPIRTKVTGHLLNKIKWKQWQVLGKKWDLEAEPHKYLLQIFREGKKSD